MFDIGFWELMIIGVVALLVIGPQRLPEVARTVGLWVGRGKRLITSVKADIDKEIRAEELKKILKDQQEKTGIHSILEDTKADLESIGKQTGEAVKEAETAVAQDKKPTA